MTKNEKPRESSMLERVRRWRREAYEADQSAPDEARSKKLRELAQRYGLKVSIRQPRQQRRR